MGRSHVAVILKRVMAHRDSLCLRSPMPRVPWDGTRNAFVVKPPSCHLDLSDVVWADDVASCMRCPSATQVEPQLMHEAGILADSFQSFGMTLNFGVKKTAAIVACRGSGTKDAKRKLFGRQSLVILREHSQLEELPLPPTYKHVGVVHDCEGSMGAEIGHRVAEAWRTFRQGRKKLFRCPAVELGARLTLWRTMILSRLFYGAGAWPSLQFRDSHRVQSAILGMLRQIAVPHRSKEQRLHQCEICAAASTACPAMLMHVERLRYLRLLLRSGPDVLWALIKQDPESMSPLKEALVWLHGREDNMQKLGAPNLHWDRCEEFVRLQPQRFRSVLKSALKLDALRQRCLAALCVLHRGPVDLQGANLLPENCPAIADLQEACPICRIAFESRVAWACHASRVHQYRTQSTMLARGRTCLSCGKVYAKVGAEAELHVQCPPSAREGSFDSALQASPPETVEALSVALRELESDGQVSDKAIYDLVTSFVAPLPVLRKAVREWEASLPEGSSLKDAAESVALVLCPSCVADEVRCTPAKRQPLLPDVPLWKEIAPLPRVLTGDAARFSLRPPPFPPFSFPFDGPISVQHATSFAVWLEASANTLLLACRRVASQPVILQADAEAAKALGPAWVWFLAVGFREFEGSWRSDL